MSVVRRNIVATFSGNVVSAIAALAFVPLYIRYLGIEAYGVIGLFTTIQALTVVLDAGLSGTMNRELATMTGAGATGDAMRTLVRTLESVYWGVAILLGAAIVALAPVIATRWVTTQSLSPTEVRHAIVYMGLGLAIQWPASLYMGGLQGLQRQVGLNVINSGVSVARGVATILTLWLVSPTLEAFFIVQSVAAVVQTASLAFMLSRTLPAASSRPRFDRAELRRVWRFAAGMSGVTIMSLLLMQSDKVVLSKTLTLAQFGYYMLAWTAASSLYRLTGPLYTALFPRFAELMGRADSASVRELYHRGSQLLAAAIMPATFVLVAFASDIFFLWTHDRSLAASAGPIAALLVVGTSLNGLYNLPYAIQLASGWTSLAVISNAIGAALYVPALLIAARQWGALGAAGAWIALNAAYLIVNVPVTHRRLLPRADWEWYTIDVGVPTLASAVVATVCRFAEPSDLSVTARILAIGASFCAAQAAAVIASPRLRAPSLGAMRAMFGRAAT